MLYGEEIGAETGNDQAGEQQAATKLTSAALYEWKVSNETPIILETLSHCSPSSGVNLVGLRSPSFRMAKLSRP